MAGLLGLDAKLYYNSGTYALPTWVEVENTRDVTVNLESAEADATRRGGGGWRETLSGLKDASIEFEMLYDNADADFGQIKDAFFDQTDLELLVLDGSSATSGSEGLRATCRILSFTVNQPLEEALTVSVSAKPALSDNAPAWYTVP